MVRKIKSSIFATVDQPKVVKKEIKSDDDCICCDTCGKWFHNLCQLKSVEEFEAIKKLELFWVCSFCQEVMPLLFKHAAGVKDQVAESLSEFKDLLTEQAGSVAGATASSKESCRVQVAAYNDLKRQLDEHAGLIKACQLTCEEQSKLMTDAVTRIETRVTQHGNMVAAAVASEHEHKKSYADAVKALDSKIEAISSKQVSEGTVKGSGAALVGAVGNFFDKEKRKNNIVIHNLPESEAQDAKERTDKNMDAFKDLLKDEFHLNAKVNRAFRAGKVLQDKPRPLVVTQR